METLGHTFVVFFILASGIVGLAFAVFQWWVVSKVKVGSKPGSEDYALLRMGPTTPSASKSPRFRPPSRKVKYLSYSQAAQSRGPAPPMCPKVKVWRIEAIFRMCLLQKIVPASAPA